jgi:hypothetical protein
MTDGKPRSKDPAAVALGRKRAAKMTPEEFAAWQRAGTEAAREANKTRSPIERRFIAMKAWRSRRTAPAWMRAAQKRADQTRPASLTYPNDKTGMPDSPGQDPIAEQAAELARMIEQAGDEALARIVEHLSRERRGAGEYPVSARGRTLDCKETCYQES